MWQTILTITGALIQIFSEWYKSRQEHAKKSYAQWRAGYELKKDQRRRRVDVSSVDKLSKK